MILQILHINSIVSPLMDSKLFFKRFVMRKFLCMQFLASFIQQMLFFGQKCAFNAAKYCKNYQFSCVAFFFSLRSQPKKDKNMC